MVKRDPSSLIRNYLPFEIAGPVTGGSNIIQK